MILKHIEAFNDPDRNADPSAADAEFKAPVDEISGRDGIIGFFGIFQNAFPTCASKFTSFSDGSAAAAEGTVSGTHDGVLPTPNGDVAPTGRAVKLRWAAIYATDGDTIKLPAPERTGSDGAGPLLAVRGRDCRRLRRQALEAATAVVARAIDLIRSGHSAPAETHLRTQEGGGMPEVAPIAEHWATGDVYEMIISALEASSKSLDSLTVEDLAPIDHFHARGFPATVELGDRLPVEAGDHILDIGCGLGGPARYFAQRFNCRVSGIDITEPFIEAGQKFTALLGLRDKVSIELGDGHKLPYGDEIFDGAYSQHVTMNVADRPRFFAEAWRVLKPGGFFALSEHGLGPVGAPHHPVPWSEDGTGEWLATPAQTAELLAAAGFVEIEAEDTGTKYLEAYRSAIALAERGELPPFSTHLLMGDTAPEKIRNAARNIEEARTHPVQVLCQKPHR